MNDIALKSVAQAQGGPLYMNTVVIISFSDLSRDPRVDRQIRAIMSNNGISVVTVGLGKPSVQVSKHVGVVLFPRRLKRRLISAALLLTRRYEAYYEHAYNPMQVISDLGDISVDLVIGNDFNSLPLAYRLAKKKGSKLLLDAHEYAPRQYEDRFRWRILHQPYNYYLGRRYLHTLNGMITVSEKIADEYQRVFGVRSRVVVNAPPFTKLKPTEVKGNNIRLVYHGAALPTRRIERIIEAMQMVRLGVTLDMLLLPAPGGESYFCSLKRLASRMINVRLMPSVPMSELVEYCNKYDVGICFLPATNFNQKYALPNKFFEYIQSRLALVIGPSPEMANYVKSFGLGCITKDFSSRSLALAINELSEDAIRSYKINACEASKVLCAETNIQVLNRVVEDLVGNDRY